MLYLVIGQRDLEPNTMYPPEILESIYNEHDRSVPCMTEALLILDVPFDDAALLSRLPWHFPANRIAVERERLGLAAGHSLLHWKPAPPPPAWLTPAVIFKMFESALSDEHARDAGDETENGNPLILPA